MIREGSATRNLEALLPLIHPKYGDRIGLVTDDRLPHDLLSEGGVDHLVRKAISLGCDPVYTIRAASYNHARYFQLARRGAIAPDTKQIWSFSINSTRSPFDPFTKPAVA